VFAAPVGGREEESPDGFICSRENQPSYGKGTEWLTGSEELGWTPISGRSVIEGVAYCVGSAQDREAHYATVSFDKRTLGKISC
jgi:hypothetical protein